MSNEFPLDGVPSPGDQLPWVGKYWGEPWPSGICDDGEQVSTPVGRVCVLCDVPIVEGDQGSFMGTALLEGHGDFGAVHRECSLRSVLGGIGHLTDHQRWCIEAGDPDGAVNYRTSALMVWRWVAEHGYPTLN